MKWVWKYIVDDNGNPVEEEVTELEYAERKRSIKDGIECLRECAAASAKQVRDFLDKHKCN